MLTQLLQQHSALSHVLPALKDVVRNAVILTSMMFLPFLECMLACIPIPSPSKCFSSRPRGSNGARISILISASLNGAREREYIRDAQTSRACRNASTQALQGRSYVT